MPSTSTEPLEETAPDPDPPEPVGSYRPAADPARPGTVIAATTLLCVVTLIAFAILVIAVAGAFGPDSHMFGDGANATGAAKQLRELAIAAVFALAFAVVTLLVVAGRDVGRFGAVALLGFAICAAASGLLALIADLVYRDVGGSFTVYLIGLVLVLSIGAFATATVSLLASRSTSEWFHAKRVHRETV